MRSRFWSALAAGLALIAMAGPADAQFIIDHEAGGNKLRGLHGPTAPRIRRSFESDREASTTFREILAATGIPGVADRIQVRASAETANAEAQIGEDGQRYIFYNSTFMRELGAKTQKYWSLVFVIAHEVGHHIAGHLDFAGQNHRVELEADRYAGFILGRMGATHDEAIAAVGAIGSGAGTDTHPPRDQRVQIVSLGWNDGVGPVRGRPEPLPPAPAPSARAAPPVNPPAFAVPQPTPTPQPALPPQATPAPQPAPRAAAAVKPPAPPSATPQSYAFRVHTRLDGDVIATVPSDDVEACRKSCDETIGCVGYQYGGMPPLKSACQMFSAVNKRTVDTRWRSGIHSNLALSLPVAYDQGTAPEAPKSAAPAPAPKAAAVKSEVANLRFGYKTRTYAAVVGGETLKTGPADAPLGCLLMCMNTRLCTVASFSSVATKGGQGAGQGGTCTAYGTFTRIDADKPDGQTVIFKE
jgi:cell division septation protein DedD